jgi:putative transposase
VRFIDEHKNRADGGLRWGVEPICVMLTEHNLKIAPAIYYAAKTRPASARTIRDAAHKPVIERVHRDNYGVYGVRKMHAALRREDVDIGRDQTARPMHELGPGRGAPRQSQAHNAARGRGWPAGRSGQPAVPCAAA